MKLSRKQQQQRDAADRREAKRIAHERMMAEHAAHNAAMKLWEAAYDAWMAADCVGPRPISPAVLKERQRFDRRLREAFAAA